jgi:hypothetical protein
MAPNVMSRIHKDGGPAEQESGAHHAKPRALLGVVVMFVLVVLGVAGSGTPTVTGRRVLMIGDSLTGISTAELGRTLRANGWEPEIVAVAGTSIGKWVPKVAGDAAFARADVAVVELGTNNCLVHCRPLGPEIDVIVRSLLDNGVQRIFWVNVQEDLPNPVNRRFVNDEIERAIVRWPQVSMIDLDTTFAGHPEWHVPDGVHFNAAGQRVFADLVARALQSAKAS